MARIATLFAFMVLLAVVVEGRDWRFNTVNRLKRVKRGFSGGFGPDSGYGGSNENASVSGERLACGEELGGSYGSGSRELGYNRDRLNDNRHNRSFSKATASASATAHNEHRKANL